MTEFELTLKNDKRRQYDRIAWIMVVLNMILFGYMTFFLPRENKTLMSALGFATCVSAIAFTFFKILTLARDHKFQALAASSGLWLLMQQWWFGLAVLLVTILYRVSTRSLDVVVNNNNVRYPSFPRKSISWNELNNIVLKDDLLTIDFKNNRIIQQMIEKTAESVDEQEFNDFCREQLRSAKPA